MSYGAAAAVQAALYDLLVAVPALSGVPVLDAVPKGGGTGTFVLIGPEEVLDRSDGTRGGAEHRVQVSVITDAAGFAAAKAAAVAVSDAMVGGRPALARGRLVETGFVKAVARRIDDGRRRRIDLTFRLRVEI